MRRWLLIFALVASCAVASCSRRPTPPAVRDTLYRHLDGDPPTLDPTTTADEVSVRVEEMIYRPLVGIDRERRLVPALALSWAASSDGLAYDFRLDPNARWEDGSPITSADVAYTIERVRDPKVAAVNWRWGFEDVAKVETPDALSVLVRFQRPFAERLLAFTLPIVSAAAFTKRGDAMGRHPLGSGPYRLESWEPNQKLTLVRRADVPAAQYPFTKVVFRVIPDNAVRFRAGSLGELDEFRVTRDQRPAAERSPEFAAHNRMLKVPQFLTVMVVWNCRHPFLADRRVRFALARSWPRASTALRLYPPDGATLVSGPYPATARENAPDVKPPEEDPAAAARLLEQAGWKLGTDGLRSRAGKKASIEFIYPAGLPAYGPIGQILKEAYEKVGVELTLRPFDWATYSQRFAAGEFDAVPYANWFLPPNLDQYPFLHSSQTPPNGQNVGFYKNPEADGAIEKARREMDDGRRLELYRQVHRIVAADPPADFLWSVEQPWGVSKSLANVEVSPLGLFHFLPGPLAWKPIPPSLR
jgi:peptide/nickel transport system substrate-binding protein